MTLRAGERFPLIADFRLPDCPIANRKSKIENPLTGNFAGFAV
jgi:hypothetical protein